MEIDVDGRRVLIQPTWTRSDLQEHLLKVSLSLTKIDNASGNKNSVTHSLATCLLQHASSCYNGFRNLGAAWYSQVHGKRKKIKCDEKKWIKFCLSIEKKRVLEERMLYEHTHNSDESDGSDNDDDQSTEDSGGSDDDADQCTENSEGSEKDENHNTKDSERSDDADADDQSTEDSGGSDDGADQCTEDSAESDDSADQCTDDSERSENSEDQCTEDSDGSEIGMNKDHTEDFPEAENGEDRRTEDSDIAEIDDDEGQCNGDSEGSENIGGHRKVDSNEFKYSKHHHMDNSGRLEESLNARLTVMNSIIKTVVGVFDKFNWFELVTDTFRIICIIGGEQVEIRPRVHQTSSSSAYYIWYNSEEEHFHCIVKWIDTFQDIQVYRVALMCQLAQNLKEFYIHQLNNDNPNDDELERRSMDYLDRLNEQFDRTTEDYLSLVKIWDPHGRKSVGLTIMLNELLDRRFDQSRFDIDLEVRQDFITSLEHADDELQILRREEYEKARLKAIENKEEDERQVRLHKLEIEAATTEIVNLQREIDEDERTTAEQTGNRDEQTARISSKWRMAKDKVQKASESVKPHSFARVAEEIIQQKRELLQSKKEELEWNRFCVLLNTLHPPYEMVRDGRNHKLFTTDYDNNPVTLVNDTFDALGLDGSFKSQNGDRVNLTSYVSKNPSKVSTELQRILLKFVQDPLYNLTGSTWKFDGCALILSNIRNKLLEKNKSKNIGQPCEEINISATKVIHIDCSWTTPGVSLVLSAPVIQTVNTYYGCLLDIEVRGVTDAKYTIDTSGYDAAKTQPTKAPDGNDAGNNGIDGNHGEAGQSAGHVSIVCDKFLGRPLNIKARGGNGADGQHGGDGKPGRDGNTGEDGGLQPREKVNQDFDYIPLRFCWAYPKSVYRYFAGKSYNTEQLVKGKCGTPGQSGGSGGNGGCGGQGGFSGEVNVQCTQGIITDLHMSVDNENGDDGEDGNAGKGAVGGKGGIHGLDYARVFEPDDLNPWFWISGNWRDEKGHLRIDSVYRTSDGYKLGSKIVTVQSDVGRATNGEQGENGQKVSHAVRCTAVAKRALADLETSWKSDSVAAKSAESRLQKKEAAVQRLGQAITASNEAQRRAMAAAKEQEKSEKKLQHAREREQRMREAFRSALTQSSSQVMRTTQRTQSIASHQSSTTESNVETRQRTVNSMEEACYDRTNTSQIFAELRPTSDSDWNDLQGVALLDALVAEYSNDVDESQTLSLLTQSLVLQIYLSNELEQNQIWESVTKIVRCSIDNCDHLKKSLNTINQDIDLVQQLIVSQQGQLLKGMRQILIHKTGGAITNILSTESSKDGMDILGIMFAYRQVSWTYEDLKGLLHPLEKWKLDKPPTKNLSEETAIELECKNRLIELLGGKLISVASENMIKQILTELDEDRRSIMLPSQTGLLKDLLHICSRHSTQPVEVGTFFDKLMAKFRGGKKKTADEIDNTYAEFAQCQLGVMKVRDVLPSDKDKNVLENPRAVENIEKLNFLLERFKISVVELDIIRRELEKKKVTDMDPYKTTYELAEQTFVKFYWNREWNEVHNVLFEMNEECKRQTTSDQNSVRQCNAILVTVDRLKKALSWTYSGKSYKEKIEICSKLKKKLLKKEWSDTFSSTLDKVKQSTNDMSSHIQKCMDWVDKKSSEVIGSSDMITGSHNDTAVSEKEMFMSFIRRLQSINKPTGSDIEAIRPQFRKALHYLHHNREISLTTSDMELLNIVLDERRQGLFKGDLSITRDETDLRAEYIRHWPERYFLRWTDCWDDIDKMRQDLWKNWKEHCIDRAENTVIEPTKIMRRMSIVMNKYAFLTTFFLPPTKCAEEWRYLRQQIEIEDLEDVIRTRATHQFGNIIQQIVNDTESSVNTLLKSVAKANLETKSRTDPQSADGCHKVGSCLELMDMVMNYGLYSSHAQEMITIFLDITLLLTCLLELDDSNSEQSAVIISKIEHWKTLIVNISDNARSDPDRVQNEISQGLTRVLDILFWSTTIDDKLCEELESRSKRNRDDVQRAIRCQKTFTDQLRGHIADELKLISATTRYLKNGDEFTPWTLGCHRNRHLSWLVQRQVDIWIDCTQTFKSLHPDSKTADSFFEVLLTSTADKLMLESRIALATILLANHISTPTEPTVLGRWSELVANLTTMAVSSGHNVDKRLNEMLVELQAALVGHFSVFQTQQLSKHSKANQMAVKVSCKMIVDQFTSLSRLVGKSHIECNRLLIRGLKLLVENLDKCCKTGRKPDSSSLLLQFIHDLFADKINVKIKEIIDVVFAIPKQSDEQRQLFTPTERAFLERCLRNEACSRNNKHVVTLYNEIKKIKKNFSTAHCIGSDSLLPTQPQNRFGRLISFESVFTKEEMRFVAIVGPEMARDVLLAHQPVAYLHVLTDLAVNEIYRKLIGQFHATDDDDLSDILISYKQTESVADSLSVGMTVEHGAHKKRQQVVDFRRSFNRAYFFAKRDNTEFEWLLWLQETVLKSMRSLRSDLLSLTTLTDLISTASEFPLHQLFLATSASRPYRWMDDILVTSIVKTLTQLDEQKQGYKDQQQKHRWALTISLHKCLQLPHFKGRAILNMLRHKLEKDAQLVAANESIDSAYILNLVTDLQELKNVDDINRFRGSSLRQWPRLIRHFHLAGMWPSNLADQLTAILDRRLGQEKTDRFLQLFVSKFSPGSSKLTNKHFKLLEAMMKNLSKFPWIIEHFFSLTGKDDFSENGREHKSDDSLWELIQSRELIEQDRSRASQVNLSAKEILEMMWNDPESKAIITSSAIREEFNRQIDDIKRRAMSEPKNNWTLAEISKWTTEVKESKNAVDPVEFLSVAMRAVKLKMDCQLRDSQLLAILIFVSSKDFSITGNIQRRMAQISTGEGKTLITALLVVYHVLSNWSNGRRSVDIITSSSVLAVANVNEMRWFYGIFEVGVENNCDAACCDDENLRRRRYNTDVIYGDLSSFQRDILLSRFISDRDITCNRKAGAVVVDEVDSMLLDKGENILYLSHKIPEMDDLLPVFVEIWNAVHDPLAANGDEEAQAAIFNCLKDRIETGALHVPTCLKSFVLRYLLVWIRNAYRAKYLVTTKDTYKVDDVGDGRGQQIIIMDKETGVEQVQMQWSHGLHQFLQLKHTLKLSPVSLKAVFMSNIGFFDQRKDAALYGMTGTLGSTAECQLLHQVFDVDFFKMPRFRRRYCIEEDHILSATKKQWLEDIVRAMRSQLISGKAVLIVCENIAAAEDAFNKISLATRKNEITCNPLKYISSFDKDFQRRQHDMALEPGDVIVATNLAGRGTDFKISDSLAKNGGLHVIIGYMPANARVEAQIEGRVARAGQPGSFQFVMWDPSVSVEQTDVASELSRLKIRRDDQECRRLEHIRTRGLQKIFLEEKLFERFHKEVHDVAKKCLSGYVDIELQLKFLTNRWALWLDENAHNIDNIHSIGDVEKNFDSFRIDCLTTVRSPTSGVRIASTFLERLRLGEFRNDCLTTVTSLTSGVCFASTPSELLTLGEFHEKSNEPDKNSESFRCYEKIIQDEPNACEIALIHLAKLKLYQTGDFCKKNEAKLLLIRANELIAEKVSCLSVANSMIKKTSETHKNSQAATMSENRFDEQITNVLSLLQVHKTAIDDILGRSIDSSVAMHFTNEEEARAIMATVSPELKNKGVCKTYRLSKKVSIHAAVNSNTTEVDCILWTNYGEPNQKQIDWPSEITQYRQDTVQLIQNKNDDLRKSFTHTDLKDVIVTKNKLWQALIADGYVGQVMKIESDVIRWRDRQLEDETDLKTRMQTLPEELSNLRIILIDWLTTHDGEDFSAAVLPLDLDSNQTNLLAEFLNTAKIIVHLSTERGLLEKQIICKVESTGFSYVVGLTEQLKQFEFLLAAWLLKDVEVAENVTKNIGEQIYLDEMPCPDDADSHAQLLFNHLVSEGVIKKPVVWLKPGLKAVKVDIDECFDTITQAINMIAKDTLKDICWKYRPPPKPITTHSYVDNPSWWAHKAWTGVGDALSYVNPFSEKSGNDDNTPTNVDEWLTEKQNAAHLDSYRNDVVNAIKNSLGKLKTTPVVSASFQPLSDYFKSNQSRTYPVDELQSLADKSFIGVIKLEAATSWWDYWDTRALFVALAGVAQIAAGVAITWASGGLLGVVGNALISEGVSDIMFAVQSSLTGSFSWEGYKQHKKWSVAMSVATAGLGAYLTKGASAGRLAAMGLKGKAGLSLFWAATKTVLTKCGKAIMSTLTSMGAEKLLSWLKKFVIENILVHVKFLISKVLGFMFNALSKALDKIWAAMKNMGRRVEDIKGVIDEQLNKAKSSDLFTLWGRRVAGQANSVGSAIGRCFSESSDVLSAEGKNDLFDNEKADGLNVLKNSFKCVKYAEKAMKLVSWVKNGTEIMGLIAYGPEYVNNVEQTLAAKARNLEAEEREKRASEQVKEEIVKEADCTITSPDEEDSYEDVTDNQELGFNGTPLMYNSSAVESETRVFNEYKEAVKHRIEGEVITYMVDSVTKTWVQPWLQSKIETLVISAGRKTCQCIGSLWQGSSPGFETGLNENKQIDEDEARKTDSEQRAAATEKELDGSIGQGNTNTETDSNGNVIVQPKNYQEVVDSLGNGQTAGLLQMQMVADATNCTIEIIDKTTEQDFKSEAGQFSITPEGNSSGKIQLVYTSNEDGTKHVSLIGPDGNELDLPGSFINADGTPAPPNRCLYEAVALAKNCSVDQLLTGVKEHALSNKQAQYLYNEKVDEALPHMRVGRKCEGDRANIFLLTDELGNVRHVTATITRENLKGGSEVTTAARKNLQETAEVTDQKGHLVGFLLGGGGGKKSNNIVNMDKSLNQGPYKKVELEIAKQLIENPGARIDLDITLNEDVRGNVDLRRPINFQISWRLTTAENQTSYYSSLLLENNPDFVSKIGRETQLVSRSESALRPIHMVNTTNTSIERIGGTEMINMNSSPASQYRPPTAR